MKDREAPELGPIVELVAARGGAVLSRQQQERVIALAHKRRAGRELSAWTAHLATTAGQGELDELVAATAVHTTELFRDAVQLEALTRHVLEPLAQTGRPLALWSAGCSTGEEVATLLVLLAEVGAHPQSRVLGTDLSAAALERARRLSFSASVAKRLPELLRRRYFLSEKDGVSLAPTLAARASFQQHNLTDAPYPLPPGGGTFDLIVCRNVLIYLSPSAIEFVLKNLAERLGEDGVLVLAAAEPILDPRDDLLPKRIGEVFIYHRPRGPKRAVPAPRPSGPSWLAPQKPLPAPWDLRPGDPAAALDESALTGRLASVARPPPLELPDLLRSPAPPRERSRPRTPRAGRQAAVRQLDTPFPSAASSRASVPLPLTELAAPEPQRVPPPRPSTRPGAPKLPPEAEGKEIFEHVLEWAHTHRTPAETESMLRQALYLAPGLAAARYVLGLHLEQHGQRALAQDEFRRALASLDAKNHLSTPFFLNDERLAAACKMALERLDARPPRR